MPNDATTLRVLSPEHLENIVRRQKIRETWAADADAARTLDPFDHQTTADVAALLREIGARPA